jgi:[acyl-carrier-protein] S-malonyltransferase
MKSGTAFLFPGQGGLPEGLPPLSDAVEEMFEVAAAHGLELRAWIENGKTERLFPTRAAQPAILIDSVAREAALRESGRAPAILAGHSLGEYAALVSAGVLSAAEALGLVIERGALMSTVHGSMAAIVKLDLAGVAALCEEAGPDVVVANHNGTHQVVVSGTESAVDRVVRAADAAGGRGIPLEVSGPFHSPFMQKARDALAERIDRVDFRPPSIPIVSGVSGAIEEEPERLRALLRDQMTACVRWVDVLSRLVEAGVSTAVEVGSGKVLTSLGSRYTDRIVFQTYEEATDG